MNARGSLLTGVAAALVRTAGIPKFAVEIGVGGNMDRVMTLELIERGGWMGMWMEPLVEPFSILRNFVASNELPITLVNAAITTYDGETDFYYCDECPGWSSVVVPADRTKKWHGRAKYEKITVACRRLSEVLGDCVVGVMVIDVEELEGPILRDMMANTMIRPAVLMVEGNTPERRFEQDGILNGSYDLVWSFQNDLDRIWVRRDLLVESRDERGSHS